MKQLILFMACTVAVFAWGEPANDVAPARVAGVDPWGALPIDSLLSTDPIRVRRDYEKGMRLYDRGNYREARPYLMTAAKSGYVQAQARLGGLFLYGYGVKRNDLQGLAWLGVAARGDDDSIKEAFKGVWERVPETQVSNVLAVIDDYARRYAREAEVVDLETDSEEVVKCVVTRKAGSAIKKESCGVQEVNAEFLDELRRETKYQAAIGTRRPELHELPPDQVRHDQTTAPF